MNTNPTARNEAHGAALEAYRKSEATLYRFSNYENTTNGRDTTYLETHSPEYVTLVQARDDARAAVEEANPAGKPPKKKAKK